MKLIAPKPEYAPMPPERRRGILPERSVCCIRPAEDSSDALYTGNGSYRLDVCGRPYADEIVVSHELLYEPKWKHTPVPPDLRPVMPEIRRHVLEGKPELADALIDKAQREAGFDRTMKLDNAIVYPTESPRTHPAFRLRLRRPEAAETRDYLRWTDLMSGLIRTQWTTESGICATEAFAAFGQDLAAVRLAAPKGTLDLELELKLPGGPGPFGGETLPNSTHRLSRSPELFTLAWAYDPEFGQKGFLALLRFESEGTVPEVTEAGLRLTHADCLTVYIRIIRVEENFDFAMAEEAGAAFLKEKPDFNGMLAENRRRLGGKMARSRLCLGDPADAVLSGEELLRRCRSRNSLDPTLMDKLYDLGRFYQIIDTGALPPMWGQHNINTNLQVCAGNNTGLFEEMDTYFRYYETKLEDFRTNARLLFGARGLLATVHCDPDSGLFYHFSRTYPHYCWTGCLGWIYNEFWGYYLCTGDTAFLRARVIPVLKEIALFYEDYACLRDDNGKRIFVPSFSPENPTPNPGYETVTSRSINPTRINSVMDIAICREVVTNLITGCETLGIETENLPRWRRFLGELPDYLLDREGGLKEWAWPTIEENYNHRHVSHHYDVWPGRAVTPETEPELAEAIRISNRKRGQQDDSAHGIIHRAFTAIRLRDQEELLQNLSQLTEHGFVRENLSTAHFPYRGQFPDLQGAMPALLLEMCVYSAPGVIELLPALPARFEKGSIEGLWLYTWVKLERLEWSPAGIDCTLVSGRDQELTLRCRRPASRVSVNGGTVPAENGEFRVSAKAGETMTVRILP